MRGSDGLSSGEQIGRYHILARLGAGGMGVVYRAYDPQLERQVALKTLRLRAALSDEDTAALVRLLVSEARAIAQLSHPNIIAVYDVGIHDDQPYMSFELVRGETLGERWAKSEHGWRDVVEQMIAAGQGLAAAHRAGILHRDFKPANVMRDADGRILVLDFGIAGQAEGQPTETAETGTLCHLSQLTGTPGYMALEQLHGQAGSPRSDQFSFAVSLYEGLFGKRPFVGADVESQAALLEAPAYIPASVPRWLQRVVARGLAKNPEDRFSSMDDLLRALEHGLRRRSAAFGHLSSLAATCAGLVLVTAGLVRASIDPCEAAQAASWNDAWTDLRAVHVRRKLREFAEISSSTVESMVSGFDAYAAQWRSTFGDVCRESGATQLVHSSDRDLRMACLQSARDFVDHGARILERADRTVASNGTKLLDELPDLRRCADADQIRQQMRLPSDPHLRARTLALRPRFARAQALRDAGLKRRALEDGHAILEEAQRIGSAHMIANAHLLLGSILKRTSKPQAMLDHYRHAQLEATKAGDPYTVSLALIRGLFVRGYTLNEWRELEFDIRLTHADLVAAGEPEALLVELYNVEAIFLAIQGKLSEGASLLEVAVDLERASPKGDGMPKPHLLGNLASMLRQSGKTHRALHYAEESLRVAKMRHGEAKAILVDHYGRLSTIELELGKLERALLHIRRANEICEATASIPDIGCMEGRGWEVAVLRDQGKLNLAARQLETLVAIQERTGVRGSYETNWLAIDAARLALVRGDLPQALSHARSGVQRYAKEANPNTKKWRSAHFVLANVWLEMRRADQAREHIAAGLRVSAPHSTAAKRSGTFAHLQAKLALLDGNPDRAIDILQPHLASEPETWARLQANCALTMAAALRRRGMVDETRESLEHVRRFLQAQPAQLELHDIRVKMQLESARLALREGAFARAEKLFADLHRTHDFREYAAQFVAPIVFGEAQAIAAGQSLGPRASRLARRALGLYESGGSAYDELAGEVRAWMASRNEKMAI